MSKKLRVLSLFSGIGAFEKALENLGVEHEVVGFSEIDKFAIKSYCAIHGIDESFNLGDVSKIDSENIPDCDMVTYGFPCQDISVAGKQKGIIKGETRSGLLYEALRIIEAKKPKYAIAENVKNLVGKKFIDDFNGLLVELDNMGYNSYWKVLNTKDSGIPQNRERVFIVSIRKDIDTGFQFPLAVELKLRLKDMLEEEVDEKYYISQDKVDKLIQGLKGKEIYSVPLKYLDRNQKNYPSEYAMCVDTCNTNGIAKIQCVGNVNPSGNGINGNVWGEEGLSPTLTTNKGEGPKILQIGKINSSQDGIVHDVEGISQCLSAGHGNTPKILQIGMLDIKGNEQVRRVYSDEGLSPTLNTMAGGNRQPKVMIKEATKKGYAEATVGDSINIQFPDSKTRRGRGRVGVAQTLETSCNQATLTYDYRIRKLTPLECWRLQGFSDEDFYKASKVNSNSQLYKQAGNSITTTVLFRIFSNLFKI